MVVSFAIRIILQTTKVEYNAAERIIQLKGLLIDIGIVLQFELVFIVFTRLIITADIMFHPSQYATLFLHLIDIYKIVNATRNNHQQDVYQQRIPARLPPFELWNNKFNELLSV